MAPTRGKTIYGSLPPQVTGKKCGELVLKITKFHNIEIAKVPLHLIGYNLKFHWWGQQSDAIILPLPWKVSHVLEEAIFPIRVNRFYFEEYLSDMNELLLEITTPEGLPYGYATIPMESIIHRNLIYREGVSVFKHGAGQPKLEIAKLFIEIVCHFDHPSAIPSSSSRPRENKPQLSVFQRVEVFVSFVLFISFVDLSLRHLSLPIHILGTLNGLRVFTILLKWNLSQMRELDNLNELEEILNLLSWQEKQLRRNGLQD
jgi:hypothetical protein